MLESVSVSDPLILNSLLKSHMWIRAVWFCFHPVCSVSLMSRLKATRKQNQTFQLHMALRQRNGHTGEECQRSDEIWAALLFKIGKLAFLSFSSWSVLPWLSSSSADGNPSTSCWSRETLRADCPCGASRTPCPCSHGWPLQVRTVWHNHFPQTVDPCVNCTICP